MKEAEFNSLPLTQRVALQQRLIDAGLYAGSADGKWGPGTKAGFEQETKLRAEKAERDRQSAEKERSDKLEAERLEIERRRVEQESKQSEAERAAKQAKDAESTSPAGIAMTLGAGLGAPLVGYAAGRKIGNSLNERANESQTSKNNALRGAATDRMAGTTTREGARTATTRSGAMPSQNALARVGGRMLPHTLTGAGLAAKGGLAYSMIDEDDPLITKSLLAGTGLGMMGAGVGTIEQGANYAINPGVAPDARSIAIMESNQIRRGGRAVEGEIFEAGPRNALKAQPQAPAPRTIEAQAMPQIENKAITSTQPGERGDTGRSAGAPQKKIETQGQPTERNPANTRIANFSTTGESAELGKDPGKPSTKIETQAAPKEMPYRERLRMAVESVGGKPGRTKQANYEAFKSGLTAENLPEVAKALNLPEGATKSTVLQRAREMLRTAGKGSFFLPMLAGGLAYQMADSPAEASADGTPSEASMQDKLLAGGTAAATAAGVQKGMSMIPPAAGAAVGIAGGVLAPFAAADTSDMMTPEDRAVGQNWLARNIPATRHLSQDMTNAYDMAQVPEPNPRAMGPRVPGGGDFNSAYQEFLALLAERD